MNDETLEQIVALLERIALALEGKPKVNLYSGPRHNGQHGTECLVCHPAVQERASA